MVKQWRKITNSSKITLYCPLCEVEHEVRVCKGATGYIHNGKEFNVEEQWFECLKTDYEFVNGEILEYNLNNIRNKIKGE